MNDQTTNTGFALASLLADRLHLDYTETRPHPAFVVYTLDLGSALRLGGMDAVRIVDTIEPSMANDETYQVYRELLTRPDWRYIVKLIPLRAPTPEILAKFRRFDNLAILLEQEFAAFSQARSVLSLLRDLFRKGVDINTLSPYQYTGAVTGTRFVGREQQLGAIMKHPERSYLVTGIRMSGKTSLLQEAKRRIQQAVDEREDSDASIPPKVIYLDCKKYGSVAGFINGLLTEMQIRTSFAAIERWESPNRWHAFYSYLKSAVKSRPDRRMHIFLDEYDSVIDFDRRDSAKITWNFRALQQSNVFQQNNPATGQTIQFVFAGSKALTGLAQNRNSDLYNFVDTESCLLHNFEIGQVKTLIEDPLEDLGLSIEDTPLVADELLSETGGHPASVQYVCAQIVLQLRKSKQRTVKKEFVRDITRSAEFYHHFEGTLYENVDKLEDFILRLVSKDLPDGPSFSLEQVAAILRKDYGLTVEDNSLFRSLDDLRSSGFIQLVKGYHGERYEITVPVIKRIYRGRQPRDLVVDLVKQGFARPNS